MKININKSECVNNGDIYYDIIMNKYFILINNSFFEIKHNMFNSGKQMLRKQKFKHLFGNN